MEHIKGCGPIKCGTCDNVFAEQRYLKTHAMLHTTKFACDHCGKVCESSSKLTRHKGTHTKTKRVACDICGKDFSRTEHLKVHKKAKHPTT